MFARVTSSTKTIMPRNGLRLGEDTCKTRETWCRVQNKETSFVCILLSDQRRGRPYSAACSHVCPPITHSCMMARSRGVQLWNFEGKLRDLTQAVYDMFQRLKARNLTEWSKQSQEGILLIDRNVKLKLS